MTQISNVNTTASSDQAFGSNNTLNDLDLDDFLNLMIAELQNQDPLNPLENDELIAQISQIREVGATEDLTATLNSVLLGQNISSATNLIGADVVALNDQGQRVSGNVRVVTITDGQPLLDLAIGSSAAAAEEEGNIEAGLYDYEVVWDDPDTGEQFGIELLDVRTSAFEDFQGAIQLNNLPPTDTPKRIYRTDRTGDGDRKLVGELNSGTATSFLDDKADDARTGDPISNAVNLVSFADKVTVSLDNVGEIRPPSN
ncbi:MAG: flagellar hook capping FlgD N-terminal domain-containing protein [Planctomycetota bacterium]